MVRIMIDSVDQHPAPKRIALGSDAYTAMHKQLSDRLAALEAQKDLAFSTDCQVVRQLVNAITHLGRPGENQRLFFHIGFDDVQRIPDVHAQFLQYRVRNANGAVAVPVFDSDFGTRHGGFPD